MSNGINVGAAFKVDASRGTRVSRVSSEWFSRPADERYESLDTLYDAVRQRSEHSRTRTVESKVLHIEASRQNPDAISVIVPDAEGPLSPTHWSFGQLCNLVGAPGGYLRELPAALAGINLQYGVTHHRAEQVKTLEAESGRLELRAVTGPDYGRIFDHELVAAVRRIAGNGNGDTRWKVPGTLDWSSMRYNPHVDVTKETTTLYASDRDVFLFLVDDTHPIEAGRLPDGSPDLYFRGFYCWNSEVGSKTLGIASFYLRAVCQNRNLWGVEGSRRSRFDTARTLPTGLHMRRRRHWRTSPTQAPRRLLPASGRRESASSLAAMRIGRASCELRASAKPRPPGSSRRCFARTDVLPKASSTSFRA
jgi:hypothetical protein